MRVWFDSLESVPPLERLVVICPEELLAELIVEFSLLLDDWRMVGTLDWTEVDSVFFFSFLAGISLA